MALRHSIRKTIRGTIGNNKLIVRAEPELKVSKVKEKLAAFKKDGELSFENKFRRVFIIFRNASDEDIRAIAQDNATDDPAKFIKAFGQAKFDELVKDIPTKDLRDKLDVILKGSPDSPNVEKLDKIIFERFNGGQKDWVSGAEPAAAMAEVMRTNRL